MHINILKLKRGFNDLNIKLNVKSVFKIDIDNRELFIKLFNYKLLKIILFLEKQGGNN